MFSINETLFLQKTKPLYPHLKYLIGIWIWAAKNEGFSLCVSIVRAVSAVKQGLIVVHLVTRFTHDFFIGIVDREFISAVLVFTTDVAVFIYWNFF